MTKQEQKDEVSKVYEAIVDSVYDIYSAATYSAYKVYEAKCKEIDQQEAIEENETELGRAFTSGMKAGRQEMLEEVVGILEKQVVFTGQDETDDDVISKTELLSSLDKLTDKE